MPTYDARSQDDVLLTMGGDEDRAEGAGANPLLAAHRVLRGRYAWAACLGVALAAPLAWLGYHSKTPMYTSQGVVAIAPTKRQVLFATEDNQAIPFFDQYVERQGALLGSQRILAAALQNDEVRRAGWSGGTDGLRELSRAVSVSIPRRSGLIVVSVSHESPSAARAACKALLEAYERIHRDTTRADLKATEDALEAIVVDRDRSSSMSRDRIRSYAEQHGTDDLQPTIDGLNREVLSIDVQMARIASEIAGRGGAVDGIDASGGAEGSGAVSAADLPLEALAARDEELATLLRRRDQLASEIEVYTEQFSARHMEVVSRQGLLATTERLLERRAAAVRVSWQPSPTAEAASLAELRHRLGQLGSLRSSLSARLQKLVQDQSVVLAEQARLAKFSEERQEAAQRLLELRTEAKDDEVARAQIEQHATQPTGPSSDKRAMFAGMGGMLGLAMGFGLIGGVGLVRGGFRYIDELDSDGDSLLLGVVPDLEGRSEPGTDAALCIHHARALLDRRVRTRKDRGRIIAVTSPTAGDGKTTVCCSLATSFAMAKFRTVVVDADFVGRGMTSRLDLERATGLGDVLAGGSVEEALSSGGTPGLSLMPAGREESTPADRLSAADMGPLLDRLARTHDLVLVDTGPVLGSIEATVVVGLADGVLAVVSRGQSAKMFASMRRKLRSLGAELVGVVFNRAYPRDFAQSTHTSVVSAQSQRTRAVRVPDFVTMGNRGMAARIEGGDAQSRARSA